jgi:hypothetical protein
VHIFEFLRIQQRFYWATPRDFKAFYAIVIEEFILLGVRESLGHGIQIRAANPTK